MQCHPHPDFLCRRYRLAGIYIIHKLRDKVREGISYRVRHQHVPFTFSIHPRMSAQDRTSGVYREFCVSCVHVCIGTSRDKHLEQLMFRLAKGTHDIHRSRKNSLSTRRAVSSLFRLGLTYKSSFFAIPASAALPCSCRWRQG